MATNEHKTPENGSRSLGAHKEPERIEAHPEPAQLKAFEQEEAIVPPVLDNIDSTPKTIKYGAAVLLGLAFGLGCYIWYDGGIPSQPLNPQGPFAREKGYDYFNSANDYAIYYTDAAIPAPFGTEMAVQPEIVTPEVVAVPDADAAVAADVPQKVVYLFGYNSSTVPETASLTEIASKASKAGLTLDVKAYTDEHGRLAYNKRLSEKRAKAIADYLVAHGMPASKVTVHAMGPTHAFGSDAADRRAEVVAIR